MRQVEDYLARLPDERRSVLEKLRRLVTSTCPEAVEVFGYGMPGFKYNRRPLIYFASFTNHMSIFAVGYEPINRHRTELADYELRAGTIHFQPAKPLPDALLKTMIRERMADIDAGAAAKSKKA
ncbi:MAG: DUF1801 domain-containing protein [Chloroflexota bacterium]|nr:DUF1801 domain-containing protein [Chloroflexota bacterium]